MSQVCTVFPKPGGKRGVYSALVRHCWHPVQRSWRQIWRPNSRGGAAAAVPRAERTKTGRQRLPGLASSKSRTTAQHHGVLGPQPQARFLSPISLSRDKSGSLCVFPGSGGKRGVQRPRAALLAPGTTQLAANLAAQQSRRGGGSRATGRTHKNGTAETARFGVLQKPYRRAAPRGLGAAAPSAFSFPHFFVA